MQKNRRQSEDGLERLRERAGRILGDYGRDGSLDVPRADEPAAAGRPRAAGDGGGAITVNVSLSGGPIFLDDERRIRALAKEIKRLIGEDRRRGLGVGG